MPVSSRHSNMPLTIVNILNTFETELGLLKRGYKYCEEYFNIKLDLYLIRTSVNV